MTSGAVLRSQFYCLSHRKVFCVVSGILCRLEYIQAVMLSLKREGSAQLYELFILGNQKQYFDKN